MTDLERATRLEPVRARSQPILASSQVRNVLLILASLLTACSDSSDSARPHSLTWDDPQTTWDNDNWE